MQLNHISPLNAGILGSLMARSNGKIVPSIAPRDTGPDSYLHTGCHPEIVERLWDQIGTALPVDCRCLLYGTPGLVAPASGIVLAVAWGTQYILRLPTEVMPLAIKAEAKTKTRWSGGDEMDVSKEFGLDWVFGYWAKEEPQWCRAMYDAVTAGL